MIAWSRAWGMICRRPLRRLVRGVIVAPHKLVACHGVMSCRIARWGEKAWRSTLPVSELAGRARRNISTKRLSFRPPAHSHCCRTTGSRPAAGRAPADRGPGSGRSRPAPARDLPGGATPALAADRSRRTGERTRSDSLYSSIAFDRSPPAASAGTTMSILDPWVAGTCVAGYVCGTRTGGLGGVGWIHAEPWLGMAVPGEYDLAGSSRPLGSVGVGGEVSVSVRPPPSRKRAKKQTSKM